MFSYLSQRDPFYSSDTPPSKIISFFVCKKHGSWMEPVLDHSNIHKADHASPFTPPLCADVLDTGCILPQRKDNILPQKTEMPGNGSPPLALWDGESGHCVVTKSRRPTRLEPRFSVLTLHQLTAWLCLELSPHLLRTGVQSQLFHCRRQQE